ncbi:winged helix DNA-binding protein [Vineibacter terrae]|uniref:Winged helix DNA-binding protein n=2 Tax=Vineibacter terrae TaxID=2586908 RepID=A0A5C8P9D5_9HYPH|nr:winged helix DNA-binding protein [Vineibacter terrae]
MTVGPSTAMRAVAPERSERIRAMLREHKVRARIFGGSALSDPGWTMLLDLMLSHLEGRQTYLTSLCVASGLPTTNAKRRVTQLITDGLVQRENDRSDRRRVLLTLTDRGLEGLSAYLDQIERR